MARFAYSICGNQNHYLTNQLALEIRRRMETLFLADCIGIFRRYLQLLGGAPRFGSLRGGISKATL